MHWYTSYAASPDYMWRKAWWASNSSNPLSADTAVKSGSGSNVYIMTHRTKPGFFICPHIGVGEYDFDYLPPFETLELAKLAYELMI